MFRSTGIRRGSYLKFPPLNGMRGDTLMVTGFDQTRKEIYVSLRRGIDARKDKEISDSVQRKEMTERDSQKLINRISPPELLTFIPNEPREVTIGGKKRVVTFHVIWLNHVDMSMEPDDDIISLRNDPHCGNLDSGYGQCEVAQAKDLCDGECMDALDARAEELVRKRQAQENDETAPCFGK